MSDAIAGLRVLVTGAGRGIGKRLAIGFSQAGAKVGLLARTEVELDLAKLEIEQAGGIALKIRGDVRQPDQMTSAVERMRASFGGLDVLISRRRRAWAYRPFAFHQAQGVERGH